MGDVEFTWFPTGDDEREWPEAPAPEPLPADYDFDYTREGFHPAEFDERVDVSLRKHQERATRAVFERWGEGDRTTAVVHATGTGKTYIGGAVISRAPRVLGPGRHGRRRWLWLAHRDFLLDSAIKTLLRFNVDSALEQGRKRARNQLFGDPDCVVASVFSMQDNDLTSRLLEWEPDEFDGCIVDEGHHAVSKVWKRVLHHFDFRNVLLLTATPDRLDGRNIGEVCDSIADEYPLNEAIDDGWVCNIRIRWSKLRVDISDVKVKGGDLNEADLGEKLKPYIQEFAREVKKQVGDRRIILFAPTVPVSRFMADALSSIGIKSVHLDAKSKNRLEVLADYRAGNIQCLCNYGLFTEGYDLDAITAVVIMRPTKSRPLYCQMVGRGVRPADDEDLIVLDFPWVSGMHQLVKPAELFFSGGSRFTEQMIRDAEKLLEDESHGVDDILTAIKRAEEDINYRERFRLQITDGPVQSRTIEYNALDSGQAAKLRKEHKRKEVEERKLKPATPNQIRFLQINGFDGAEHYSFVRAHAVITAAKEKQNRGEANYDQIRRLTRMGMDRRIARKLTAREAAAILDGERPIPGQSELF